MWQLIKKKKKRKRKRKSGFKGTSCLSNPRWRGCQEPGEPSSSYAQSTCPAGVVLEYFIHITPVHPDIHIQTYILCQRARVIPEQKKSIQGIEEYIEKSIQVYSRVYNSWPACLPACLHNNMNREFSTVTLLCVYRYMFFSTHSCLLALPACLPACLPVFLLCLCSRILYCGCPRYSTYHRHQG